jgi:hypothetical protein
MSMPFQAGTTLTAAALNALAALTGALPSNQLITSTTAVPIAGTALDVLATTYQIAGAIQIQQGSTNVFQYVGFSGPTTSVCRIYYQASPAVISGTVEPYPNVWANMTTLTTVGLNPGGASNTSYLIFNGTVVFSVAGTLELVANEGTSGDDFSVMVGTYLTIQQAVT